MKRLTAAFGSFVLLLSLVLVLPAVSFADEGAATVAPAATLSTLLSCPASPVVPAGPAITAPTGSEPTFLAARWCCLEEWQPGPCGSSQYYARMCTNACGTCGSFSCIPKTTSCLK